MSMSILTTAVTDVRIPTPLPRIPHPTTQYISPVASSSSTTVGTILTIGVPGITIHGMILGSILGITVRHGDTTTHGMVLDGMAQDGGDPVTIALGDQDGMDLDGMAQDVS